MNFNVGDKIKLKNYGYFSDYQSHKDEVAEILYIYSSNYDLPYRIKWEDNSTSQVAEDNMILFRNVIKIGDIVEVIVKRTYLISDYGSQGRIVDIGDNTVFVKFNKLTGEKYNIDNKFVFELHINDIKIINSKNKDLFGEPIYEIP